MFDLLIKNGKIIDGAGNPWYKADLGVTGDKIACIDYELPSRAEIIIDAEGKYVVPGFIDIHTHSDFTILPNPRSESKIRQGITTELGGHCGFSLGPVEKGYLPQLKKFMAFMPEDLSWEWDNIGQALDRIASQGTSVNFGTLIGQGVLRIAAMGFDKRLATGQELAKMKYDLADSLDQGALGLSAGLVYAPGSYAPAEELLDLVKIVAAKNKLFTAHIRDEGDNVVESLAEVLTMAEQTGVALQVCHLKATGRNNWHKMDLLIEMIEKTREKGIDVTFDVYPYNALNTLLTALLPGWAQAGGVEGILNRLHDKDTRLAIMKDLEQENVKYGGWENIMIASAKQPQNEWAAGHTIKEMADIQSKSPHEAMLDLLRDDECSIFAVCFSMADENVEKALRHPLAMLGSDGKSLALTGKLAAGRPHPRNYGAFPRLIAKYVKEKPVLTLPEAIRKMTAAPAQKLRLKNRGLLKEGFFADIAVIDYETIDDAATFVKPQQYPRGVDYVIVNGKLTIKEGEHTGALSGKIIK